MDEVWPHRSVHLPFETQKKEIREIWKYMLGKVIIPGGPFAGAPKSDHLGKIVDKAVRLSPWGIPERCKGWRRPIGVQNSEYEEWLRTVFGRTAPSPISGYLLFLNLVSSEFTVYNAS